VKNAQIIGLPVLISERFRVVLDQALCRRYGIPENGFVKVRTDGPTIFIYPADSSIQEAEQKKITIGRFNLPMPWVRQNQAKIGGYAYLMATGSCIQLRWAPWECRGIGYILGIPAKIYSGSMLYIPRTFWSHYGFNPDSDSVIRRVQDDAILFMQSQPRPLANNESLLRVYLRSVHIPPQWVKQHDLKINDTVWLVGAEEGLTVSPQQWFQFEKIQRITTAKFR
jgi:hypothetical protein